MKITLILCGLFITALAGAQDSLSYYMLVATERSPVVMQKYYDYQAALQKVRQSGALPDPELNMGVFLSPMELVGGKEIADIRLMQMFPWFGTLRAAKDEMSLMANAAFESLRDSKLQVFFDVQKTGNELYKVRKDIQFSQQNLEILNALEKLMLSKYKSASPGGNSMNGENPGSVLIDLYQVQMEVGDLSDNIEQMKDQQQTLLARFNNYLRRPAMNPVFISDSLVPDTLDIPASSLEDSIYKGNPMLQMAQLEKQSIGYREKMISRMGYPMVGLGVDYSWIRKTEMATSGMNGKDMVMPMITVTLPVYRKKYKAMRNEAGMMKAATEQKCLVTRDNLRVEYYDALALYEESLRKLKLYKHQLTLAEQSQDITTKSYQTTGRDLADVLRMRRMVLDYQMKLTEALADLNTAAAWIRRLMASQRFNNYENETL